MVQYFTVIKENYDRAVAQSTPPLTSYLAEQLNLAPLTIVLLVLPIDANIYIYLYIGVLETTIASLLSIHMYFNTMLFYN